jgi:deoxyribodipyrimidine photo-lyase
MKRYDRGLMWFRRDLRAEDNTALHHALASCRQVWCVFVFDTEAPDAPSGERPGTPRRMAFVRACVVELDAQLRTLGRAHGHAHTGLIVRQGPARHLIPALAERLGVLAVFANHDDEPAAKARDAQVLGALAHAGVMFHTHRDQVIFGPRELLGPDGHAPTTFGAYRNAWLRTLDEARVQPWPVAALADALAPLPGAPGGEWDAPPPRLGELGVEDTTPSLPVPPGVSGARRLMVDFLGRIEHYHLARHRPAAHGPSYLGAHLRHGTLSVREAAAMALRLHRQGMPGATAWLTALARRDFCHQILANHPHVVERAFRPAYEPLRFERGRHAQALLAAWQQARTGYPIVDAAMTQLHTTGYMHHRLRQLVACFVVRHLGLHWRLGEAHFAQHLLDHDTASNNAGWQWAAASGCEALPLWSLPDPIALGRRLDPRGCFLRRYLPALASLPDVDLHAPWQADPGARAAAGVSLGQTYPRPVVDPERARERWRQRCAANTGPA